MNEVGLAKIANELRISVLRMIYKIGGGHIAGPLSSAELFATMYFGGEVKIDPKQPWAEERDRIVLSCGHYAPILYATLAKALFFPPDKIMEFGKTGSELTTHPERLADKSTLPGIETTSGPLGQGLSQAVGMALALKLRQNKISRVYCVVSDGELEEGQSWEAIMLSVTQRLDNLVFLIDQNGIQIEADVVDIAPLGEILRKLEAWGIYTLEIDGHDTVAIQNALAKIKKIKGIPSAIVCRTIAGKGVSFMETKNKWHDGTLSQEQLTLAINELEGKIV